MGLRHSYSLLIVESFRVDEMYGGLHQKSCTRANRSPNPTFGRLHRGGKPLNYFLGVHMFKIIGSFVGAIGSLGPTVGWTQVHFRFSSKCIVQATLQAGDIRHLNPFLGMVQDFWTFGADHHTGRMV